MLLELHGRRLATTLIPPDETEPLNDPGNPRALRKAAGRHHRRRRLPLEPTTVLDLTPMNTGGDPVVVRGGAATYAGAGAVSPSQGI